MDVHEREKERDVALVFLDISGNRRTEQRCGNVFEGG